MDYVIISEEAFTLDVTPQAFEEWLTTYFMSQHPSHAPSVWRTYSGGVVYISYHAPPDGRITFECMVPESEKLKITKITGYPGWDNYFTLLIEKIKQRWGSKTPPHGFNHIIQNKDLADNLAWRWTESERTFGAGTYLATIILLGSILEGLLLAKVQSNLKQANQSNSAPKERDGKVRPLEQWGLENLINVAFDCGWVSQHTKDHSKYLQTYRNLVHPRKQVESGFYPDEEACKVAKSVISAAISDLTKN